MNRAGTWLLALLLGAFAVTTCLTSLRAEDQRSMLPSTQTHAPEF